jgi:uncharacterized protein
VTAIERIGAFDWPSVARHLDARGFAFLPGLLHGAECDSIAESYDTDKDSVFRSRVVMARHGFGRGEYRYFAYPLAPPIQQIRSTLYPHLAPLANRWHDRLGFSARFPPRHEAFLERCHIAGQATPTPLLLKYESGDYNCLHQDLYGEHVFPLQTAILLSEPGRDFEGGEFVLAEQRPRKQSRVTVAPLRKGDALIFAVNSRPAPGTRGDYRVNLRHGVSEVRWGRRFTLGIIFHDAT